jgi:hypothetical protein
LQTKRLYANKKALPFLDKASREKQPEHAVSNVSLRWHYPDQVDWVGDKKVTLSARLTRAPRTVFFKDITLPSNPKIAHSPRPLLELFLSEIVVVRLGP